MGIIILLGLWKGCTWCTCYFITLSRVRSRFIRYYWFLILHLFLGFSCLIRLFGRINTFWTIDIFFYGRKEFKLCGFCVVIIPFIVLGNESFRTLTGTYNACFVFKNHSKFWFLLCRKIFILHVFKLVLHKVLINSLIDRY